MTNNLLTRRLYLLKKKKISKQTLKKTNPSHEQDLEKRRRHEEISRIRQENARLNVY